MATFCPNCEAGLADETRFCSWCGAPVGDGLVRPILGDRRLTDTTAPIIVESPRRPLVAPGPLGRERETPTRRLQSHRSLLALATCGVLVAAVAGLAFAAGGSFHTPTTSRSPAPPAGTSTVARRSRTGSQPAAHDPPPERVFVVALDEILQQSATGHTQLVGALDGAQLNCPTTALAASQQIQSVMSNRATALQELATLPPAPNPQIHTLEALLQQALQASAQADSRYEAWASSLGTSGSAATCAGSPGGSDVVYGQARSADGAATTFKREFVTAFNPVAARFALPPWTEAEF